MLHEPVDMIGRIFMGRYEAVRLLGEGGMGKVYLAHQIDLDRNVVIKVMHEHVAADPVFRERFQRETMLMARFQHPNAVTLYDASLSDGPCIVMEYIRGVNLDTLLEKNGRFSPGRVARIIGQLCEVLHEAHQVGIVHRDLKPSNLMLVDYDSPRERLKVMDFGLAKLVDQAANMSLSASSHEFAIGTPGYICPEQVKGEKVDHRGDIYSVGVIMYELLCGRLPFVSSSANELMISHATEPPPSFRDIGFENVIPHAIERVVLCCLAKDPEKRPQSAAELLEMYESALANVESGLESKLNMMLPPELEQRKKSSPQLPLDPNTYTFQMEAWMPEAVAILKLQGFAHDFHGEIVRSVPGLIQMLFQPPQRGWGFFSRRPDPIRVDLMLHFTSSKAGQNKLFIQVVFRPSQAKDLQDRTWRARCENLFVELRSYLMGT